MKKSQKRFELPEFIFTGALRATCIRLMKRNDTQVVCWPPTAHELYVRNQIPRGAYYDPADDGPEVEIINREAACQAFEFFEHSQPGDIIVIGNNPWLNVGPTWPPDGEVDTLKHRRE